MRVNRILFGIRIDDDIGDFSGVSFMSGNDLAVDDQTSPNTGRMSDVVNDIVAFS